MSVSFPLGFYFSLFIYFVICLSNEKIENPVYIVLFLLIFFFASLYDGFITLRKLKKLKEISISNIYVSTNQSLIINNKEYFNFTITPIRVNMPMNLKMRLYTIRCNDQEFYCLDHFRFLFFLSMGFKYWDSQEYDLF